MDSQVEMNVGPGLEESQVQEPLFLWSWGVSPSQYMDVFTHLEALQTLCL